MKKILILAIAASAILSCNNSTTVDESSTASMSESSTAPVTGQADVADDVSQPNVVKVAVGSNDHTTLVKAIQAADLVNSLSNNGPFTVFAPTNAAFDALPSGTVDNLLKPENKNTLSDVLGHHVYVATLELEDLRDGQVLGMVDGTNAKVSIKDGKYYIDDAEVLASVPASNGIVHVVNKVILPGQ